ncbi:MAG TPA: MFS transporter [Spirochaetota bacterium]|nr:MFS transporter [Spirochaetota bacterium]HPC40283.1 MFS transporter [Spirochaetota bacterium]HQF07242.1 MFS transporter [Spirochaetota bacterium]HQH96143.1 MFS transporter [Spirochaetota bacterium]HQJ69318.1 MFS transporter [Spirochaetota bacterium]
MHASRPKSLGGFRHGLRSLRHRNFRLFFMGQGVSLVGTWMQSVATSWLVFRMTHSEFMLGIVAFAGQVPILFISPFAGVLGDRVNRRYILIAVQAVAMAQAFTLAALTLTGAVRVWQIALLAALLGVTNAFEMPSRHAFVVEMIGDKADLGNAIALNSGIFNGSRLIGPAIAGIVVARAGEGVCFALNGASYVAAMAVFIMMTIKTRPEGRKGTTFLSEIKDGLFYAFGFRPIRDLIATVALISLVAMSFPVLLPIFAGSVLGGDSHTYGFLVAATGAGALAGVAFLAMRRSVLGLGRVISAALVLFGATLIAFSFSRTAALSTGILVLTGFGMITTMASCNTMVQTLVDEDKRGRVMSFYIMAVMGTAPLGSILAGSVSSAIGAPDTVLCGGALCVLGGIVFALRLPSLRRVVRPIYHRMGIVPDDAAGIQAADELPGPPE